MILETKSMPLISIIIPVYNAQKFIKKCVNSIIGQSYKNFELILIDDGSKDNSLNTCHKLADTDKRIMVFHKTNGGVSSARNLGIAQSKGEYLCFVDADDWMERNALLNMIERIKADNADFCFGTAEVIGAIKKEKYGVNPGITVKRNNKSDLIKYTDILRTELGPWAKLFRKDIIHDNNLAFPEKVAYGEDRIFIWKYLCYCNVLCAIPETVYYYSQLNPARACGKYYAQTNEWLISAIGYYKSFLDDTKETHSKILAVALRQFLVCLRHYTIHLGIDNKAELISAMKQTYDLFAPYLTTDLDYNHAMNEVSDSDYRMIAEFLHNFDYEKLAQKLYIEKSGKIYDNLEIALRNTVAFAKRAVIYRLGGKI